MSTSFVALPISTLSQRSVHSHLSNLWMLGILSAEENQSGSWGNYYTYELDVPFESVIEAMEDALRLDVKTNAIREIASVNGLKPR